ncbi:MAG: DUF2339 domain-containing protein, partial [Planctomycetes bacterium]|nr:DUF2339 domain-containing protein [Planctomycetota bacterium]
WLEGRIKRFGEVLFGGGLALIYFSVYAAYAVGPVKVIDDPVLATLLQFLAAAGLIGCALWRKSMVIATMGIFLGYVGCFFSFRMDLVTYSLMAALVLSMASVYFYVVKRWERPLLVSVPLTYFTYGVVALIHWWEEKSAPGFSICLSYLLAYLLVFCAADYWALLRDSVMPRLQRRMVQICNTSGAVGFGFLMTWLIYPGLLSTFYFIMGGVLTGIAVVYYVTRHLDVMLHTYFVKGSALVTLGVMTAFDARTRWAALAVQSLVLLFSARRSGLKVVEGAMALVWFASFGFFVQDTYELGYFANPASTLGMQGWVSLFYLVFSGMFFCLQGRWLGLLDEANGAGIKTGAKGFDLSGRDSLNVVYSLFLGVVGLIVAKAFVSDAYFPLAAGLIGLLTVLIGVALRHWIGFAGSAIPFLFAHFAFWSRNYSDDQSGVLWINAGVVILLTLLAAVALCVFPKGRFSEKFQHTMEQLDVGFHALWMITLHMVLFRTCSLETYLLAMGAVAMVVAVVSIKYPFSYLADMSAFPLGLALMGYFVSRGFVENSLVYAEQEALLWLVMLGSFGYAAAYAAYGPLNGRIRLMKSGELYQRVHTFLALLIGLVVLEILFHDVALMFAIGVAAPMVAILSRWPGLKPALMGSLLYTMVAHVLFYLLVYEHGRSGDMVFLWVSIMLAMITLAYGLIGRRVLVTLDFGKVQKLQWFGGVLSLGLLYSLFYHQGGALHHYVTVLWGLSAIGILGLGLVFGAKPLRILGLFGLAICIPRMFIVDVRSTLYRIIAFGALSVVLLAVGFIYNKFRDTIQKPHEQIPAGEKGGEVVK